jgi:hypothetical protein
MPSEGNDPEAMPPILISTIATVLCRLHDSAAKASVLVLDTMK